MNEDLHSPFFTAFVFADQTEKKCKKSLEWALLCECRIGSSEKEEKLLHCNLQENVQIRAKCTNRNQ